MKVLVLSTDFPPSVGGIGTFAWRLGMALEKVGALVRVITTVSCPGPEPVPELAVSRVPEKWSNRYLKALPLLILTVLWVRRERAGLVVAMVWTHEGVVAYLVRKALRVRYVVVTHGSEILSHVANPLMRQVMVRILKGADAVMANSRFTQDLVLELGIDPDRVVVVNPPLPLPESEVGAPRPSCDEVFALGGKRVMFTAARLVRRKGHTAVIRALGELKQRYPDLVYVMTGEGEYKQELSELACSCDVRDQVRMIGFVSSEHLRQLYSRADLYICPAEQDGGDVEGFGIALAEAAAFGKPVIAGRSGGVPEVVVDGVTGFIIDPSNLEEIKQRIVTLLDDSNLRHQMGAAGRALVGSGFGLQAQADKLRRLLWPVDAAR